MLTTAEIHDYCLARLGHEHMAVDSNSSAALLRLQGGLNNVLLTPTLIYEPDAGGGASYFLSASLTRPLTILYTTWTRAA